MNIRTKMCVSGVAALLLQLAAVSCAPLHRAAHPAGQPLRQQLLELLELQQLHSLQEEPVHGALSIPPLIVLVPRARPVHAAAEGQTRHQAVNKETVDEDLESVIVEADSEEPEGERPVVLMLPSYARLSIGDVISAIPFLPIEINVPDTIGWAYNGISGGISSIISIFGRWPFTPSAAQNPAQRSRLKSVLQQLGAQKRSGLVPIIIMPMLPRAVPIHLPIPV